MFPRLETIEAIANKEISYRQESIQRSNALKQFDSFGFLFLYAPVFTESGFT